MKCRAPEEAFLGLKESDAVDYAQAQAVIIPFGLEASVSYGGGTARGPAAMIHASHQLELFDEVLWCEPYRSIGIVTLEEPVIGHNIAHELTVLQSLVARVLADGKFPMTFGGEHSITPGIMRAITDVYKEVVILHFDAHADLRDGYEGEHYSHASALRRCLDDSTLELVSLGIRNISQEEIPFLEANRHRIHMYFAHTKKSWDLQEILSHLKGRHVYLTFDVDGLDGSVMPATGTPEPGGLYWQEVIDIISAAAKVSHIIGADINELAPNDHLHACDFLAAKLAYKILSMVFFAASAKANKSSV